jgi:hypothetical protein
LSCSRFCGVSGRRRKTAACSQDEALVIAHCGPGEVL